MRRKMYNIRNYRREMKKAKIANLKKSINTAPDPDMIIIFFIIMSHPPVPSYIYPDLHRIYAILDI